jgi:hypothetical protein
MVRFEFEAERPALQALLAGPAPGYNPPDLVVRRETFDQHADPGVSGQHLGYLVIGPYGQLPPVLPHDLGRTDGGDRSAPLHTDDYNPALRPHKVIDLGRTHPNVGAFASHVG